MPEVWEGILGGQPISVNELKEAAREIILKCSGVKIWVFSGEIGAGKTTLIKAVCANMGVREGMSSPTFSILNEYPTESGGMIYHFDFYRLKNEREAYDLGVEEYFESGNYCFVEWPEKIPTLIPERHVEIRITPGDRTHRNIVYANHE